MTTKEELSKVKERLGCADYSEYSFDELMDQYDSLKSLEAFENAPSQLLSLPVKKDKEIALEAAIRNKPSYPTINYNQISHPHNYNLVDEADKIYQWLIKEDKP